LTAKSTRRIARRQYITYNHSIYTCKIKNCVTCADNFIVNLSDHNLSVSEKLVLSKGLTFIPTAKDLTTFEILSDFDRFTNKLCKVIHPPRTVTHNDGFTLYRHDNNINSKTNLLTTYPQFEGTLNAIKNELSLLQPNQSLPQNLSKSQQSALRNLCKNKNTRVPL